MMDIQALLSDAPKGEVSEDNDGLQVIFRRHYRKPIAKVWAALTAPERIADWLGAAEIDLRPGGSLRLTFNESHSAEIEITEVDAPRLFAWVWTIEGRATRVRFELTPEGDGTRLTLTHSGLSTRAGRDSMVRAGWHAHLEGLADAIDGRATPWSVKQQREAAVAPLYPDLPA